MKALIDGFNFKLAVECLALESTAISKFLGSPGAQSRERLRDESRIAGGDYAHTPEANRADSSAMVGYNTAQSMVEVLRRCGDVLTRDNIMRQAASFRNFEQGGLLPGITVNTSSTDFAPIKQLRLMRFEGNRWQLFGDIITGAIDE
jgi:hypothetical protein